MISTILIALLIVDSVILITAILLQAGKGGGLAASFGGVTSSADSILGTRQAGNLLTKVSWWGGGIFLGLAFVLSLVSTNTNAPRSILDQTFTAPAPTAPASTPQPGASVLPITPVPEGGAATEPPPSAPATKTP